jgi:hypothetical protein
MAAVTLLLFAHYAVLNVDRGRNSKAQRPRTREAIAVYY